MEYFHQGGAAYLLAIGSAIGLFTLVYSVGHATIALIGNSADSPNCWLLDITVGLAVYPVILLIIGQFKGVLWIFPFRIAATCSVLWAFYRFYATLKQRADLGIFNIKFLGTGYGKYLQLLGYLAVTCILILILGPAFCPPLNYDTLEYHLGVVSHFFRTQQVTAIPHVFYSAQPLATEMLYFGAALLEKTPWGWSSGVVQWMIVLLAVCLLLRVLILLEAPPACIPWLLLLFIVHPIILKMELDRLTDLTGGIFLLGGLVVMLEHDRSLMLDGRSLLLVGLMAGGAISSKWTHAGTTVPILIAATFAQTYQIEGLRTRERFRLLPRYATTLSAGALIILLPWMAWLWHYAGNPIAPFGARWFVLESWTERQLQFLISTHGPLSMHSVLYWSNLYHRLSSLRWGPPLLMFSFLGSLTAAAYLRRNEDRLRSPALLPPMIAIMGGSVMGCLLWGRLQFAQDRFLIPVVLAGFICFGGMLGFIAKLLPRRSASLLPFLILIATLPYAREHIAVLSGMPYWQHAAGRMSTQEFLRAGMGATADFFEEVNNLPEQAHVLAISEARGYYFRGEVSLSTVFDINPIGSAVRGAHGPDEIRHTLVARGYTHLLVNEYEMARLLDFHPPELLQRDSEFMSLRVTGRAAYSELVGRYWGYSEFGAQPLSGAERKLYGVFLQDARAKAMIILPQNNSVPAFWISPLTDM